MRSDCWSQLLILFICFFLLLSLPLASHFILLVVREVEGQSKNKLSVNSVKLANDIKMSNSPIKCHIWVSEEKLCDWDRSKHRCLKVSVRSKELFRFSGYWLFVQIHFSSHLLSQYTQYTSTYWLYFFFLISKSLHEQVSRTQWNNRVKRCAGKEI